MEKIFNKNTASKSLKIVNILKICLVFIFVVFIVFSFLPYHPKSPFEKYAEQFYHIDDDGLHWHYDDISNAYLNCNNSIQRDKLFQLMVNSQATHLVPQIIDSITTGGYMDTEKKIRAVISLTGYDFSKDFDITRIWQASNVQKTKDILHQWWDKNGDEINKSRGPKEIFNIPNYWPSLSLELKSEKKEYLRLEPIRLSAFIRNNSDSWFTFIYAFQKPAFEIDFVKVLDDGSTIPISQIKNPSIWVKAGLGISLLRNYSFLTIRGGDFYLSQKWLEQEYQDRFGVGKITFRAILKPLQGEYKDRTLVSNDLTLDIIQPTGINLSAYQFITNGQIINTSAGNYHNGFIYGGLIYNSGSHHGEPVFMYFLNKYGDSIYSNYVRYALVRIYSYPKNTSLFSKYLKDIIENAPDDFPLLAESYIQLLEYLKENDNIDEMSLISKTIDINDIYTLDPDLTKRLQLLIGHE